MIKHDSERQDYVELLLHETLGDDIKSILFPGQKLLCSRDDFQRYGNYCDENSKALVLRMENSLKMVREGKKTNTFKMLRSPQQSKSNTFIYSGKHFSP